MQVYGSKQEKMRCIVLSYYVVTLHHQISLPFPGDQNGDFECMHWVRVRVTQTTADYRRSLINCVSEVSALF
jgi:hypothetical protein